MGSMKPDPPPLPTRVEQALSTDATETVVKQDIGVLDEYRKWLDEVLVYKRQLRTANGAPTVVVEGTTGEEVLTDLTSDERRSVESRGLLGSFDWQFVGCGNENCICSSGLPTDLHGPYLRRQYLDGSGHYTTEYIPWSDRRRKLVQRVVPEPSSAKLADMTEDKR